MISSHMFPRRKALLATLCFLALLGHFPVRTFGQTANIAVDHIQGIVFETDSDAFSNSAVNGAPYWWLSMRNGESRNIDESSIEISTQLSTDSFRGIDPQPNSTLQEGNERLYSWKLGSLAPDSQLGVWLGAMSSEVFTPGFDSRRELTPVVIDSEVRNQTVLVTIIPRHALSRIYVDVYLEESSLILASLIPTSLLPKDANIYGDGRGVGWSIETPELHREYNFSVMVRFEKSIYPEKIFYKPRITLGGLEDIPDETEYTGSSVVAKDKILGKITYSANGKHEWWYHHEIKKEIVHEAAFGSPFVSLTVENPMSLSVVKGNVHITASGASSTGKIVMMQCSIDGGEWMPMKLGNETEQTLAARQVTTRGGFIDWDTTKLLNGPHQITIKTEDSIGISDNKTSTVIVDNSGPRPIGYSEVINFAYVVAIVIGIVAGVWIKSRKTRR